MKKYQVRKSDEMGHDYEVETFADKFEAWELENRLDLCTRGWHYYTKEIEE